MSPGRQTVSDISKTKISTTCTICRERHLRCDGPPRCSRCRSDGASCVFVESRRGRRPPAPRKTPTPTPSTPSSNLGCSTPEGNGPGYQTEEVENFDAASIQVLGSFTTFSNCPLSLPVTTPGYFEMAQLPTTDSPQLHLMNLFYENFYPSHPFLLPQKRIGNRLSAARSNHLQASMSYVGACYDPIFVSQRSSLRVAVDFAIFVQQPLRDGFLVQTLLLYALGLHANDEKVRASQILKMAVDLALELGMNHKDYARLNGHGVPDVEESWRRTWWELYILDALFAAADEKDSFRLSRIPMNCDLPCEDVEYFSGLIPPPSTWSDYDNGSFTVPSFSSYIYLIHTVHILSHILPSMTQQPANNQTIDRADAMIVDWCLSLPGSKTRPVCPDGRCDQLLLQAFMITYLCAILLHKPRSQILTSGLRESSMLPYLSSSPLDTHTAKALHAADNMALLAQYAQPTPPFTPLFTHALVQASKVHLTLWLWPIFSPTSQVNVVPSTRIPLSSSGSGAKSNDSTRPPFYLTLSPPVSTSAPSQNHISQRVQLQVGMLKSLAATWPLAASGLQCVIATGRDILARLQQTSVEPSLLGVSSLEALITAFERCQPKDSVGPVDLGTAVGLTTGPGTRMGKVNVPVSMSNDCSCGWA